VRAATLVALALAGACASLNDGTIEIIEDAPAPRAPVIDVKLAREGAQEGAPGSVCGAQPELARGSPPNDARVIVELEMTSAVPEDTRAFEETARLHALQRCATGVSVLRAVAEGRGYTSVTVALWERIAPSGVVR
jgi:hypothetical protein